MADEIPYFIKMRGCINCSSSKLHKERHGTDYGFDHELMAKCVLMGCSSYGYSVAAPFFDPAEIVRIATASRHNEFRQSARKICGQIKERFGQHYDSIGATVDGILAGLE